MEDDILAFMKSHELFKTFTSEELGELATKLTMQPVMAGAKVITQGEAGTYLGILVEGSLESVRHLPNEDIQKFPVMESGAIFGEISLITNNPHTADVIAREDSRILMIQMAEYKKFIARNLHALSLIANTTSDRLLRTTGIQVKPQSD